MKMTAIVSLKELQITVNIVRASLSATLIPHSATIYTKTIYDAFLFANMCSAMIYPKTVYDALFSQICVPFFPKTDTSSALT